MALRKMAAAMALAFCGAVCAQDDSAPADTAPDDSASSDGGDLADTVGGPRVSAEVTGASYYTDNFYYQPNDGASAWGWVVNPKLGYVTQTSKVSLKGAADGEYGTFDAPGTDDDYVDGHVNFSAVAQADTRNRFSMSFDGRHGHDPFGLNRTENLALQNIQLDKWNEGTLAGSYRVGAPAAVLNAQVGVSGQRRYYTTNRTATQELDYDSGTLNSALFYKHSPKTSVVVEGSVTNYDFNYKFAANDNRSGDLYRARVGVLWLATAKTAGDIRVGYRERTFDLTGEKHDGLDWDASVRWNPSWPATILLQTGRSEQQSYLAGVPVIDLSVSSIEWQQPWTPLWSTRLNYGYTRATYVDSPRRDDYQNGTIELQGRLSSLVTLVTSYTTMIRDSTADARDFDRSSAFLGLRIGR